MAIIIGIACYEGLPETFYRHTLYLSISAHHRTIWAIKSTPKKGVNLRWITQTGQDFALLVLKSTARKKYTTAGAAVLCNVPYIFGMPLLHDVVHLVFSSIHLVYHIWRAPIFHTSQKKLLLKFLLTVAKNKRLREV